MKQLPTDPYAFQARVMGALIDDILDPQAKGNFPRMDAMRSISSTRDGSAAEKAAPDQSNAER